MLAKPVTCVFKNFNIRIGTAKSREYDTKSHPLKWFETKIIGMKNSQEVCNEHISIIPSLTSRFSEIPHAQYP